MAGLSQKPPEIQIRRWDFHERCRSVYELLWALDRLWSLGANSSVAWADPTMPNRNHLTARMGSWFEKLHAWSVPYAPPWFSFVGCYVGYSRHY